ncbi:ABC transporter permease subunit [Clostridium sp. 'deep sea']|uniref:ABC transporter permease n=1 Tax=Clostridium sp. 'deep sea' TaxID=2779445 RepID=UPI0018969FD7|nr:ABC transporter permease subunit [Clostridium sp. 'deep sea']QOR36166.1 ABC transporter permease subunit [Clostridium sp. 'deep sea']
MFTKVLKNKQAVLGLLMIITVLIIAIFAPLIAVNDPLDIQPELKFKKSQSQFPLGTDQLGRCVFSRLVYGARYSLGIAIPTIIIVACLSLVLATFSAYYGGFIDRVFSIISDIFMSFPPLLVVLSLVGSLGQGVKNIVIAVVFSMWVWYAKVVRSYVILEKNKGYVTAAIVSGCSDLQVIVKHIIPNILPSLIVYYSTGIAGMILMVSGFSYLGLGLEAGVPEWGAMLSKGKSYLYSYHKLILYPGLFILFTAGGFNIFGEAFRDIVSPKES